MTGILRLVVFIIAVIGLVLAILIKIFPKKASSMMMILAALFCFYSTIAFLAEESIPLAVLFLLLTCITLYEMKDM